MTRRPATPKDVERMLALMAPHVAAGDLLPRTPEDVRERLHEFLLLEGNGTEGRLVGVGALHRYDAEMAEIRSLAVDPGWTGQGCGRFLASGLIEKARAEGHERLIALTRRPAFFERRPAHCQHVALFLEIGCPGLLQILLELLEAPLRDAEVRENQLVLDRLRIPERVDGS